MQNTPVNPPTPVSIWRRWWFVGIVLGGLAAILTASTVWHLSAMERFTCRAVIRIREPLKTGLKEQAPEVAETYLMDQAVLIRSRDLLQRSIAEPSIAVTETVKRVEDPVRWLQDGIQVEIHGSLLTVSLRGDNPEDLKTILDMVVKKYLDDTVMFERRSRDDRIRKLEALSDRLRGEISAKERAIRLMIDASGGEGVDKFTRMKMELAKLDEDVFNTRKEVQGLEVDLAILRKKPGAAENPEIKKKIEDVEERLELARRLLEVRSEYREKFSKGFAHMKQDDFNAQSLMDELGPKREALHDIQRNLVAEQIERDMAARISLIEPANVVVNDNLKRRIYLAASAGSAAFAVIFLSTLLLRLLRR